MKKIVYAVLLGWCVLPAAIAATNVYSPAKGVLCDRKSGFCADSQGISQALTGQYLGAAVQRKLEQTIGEPSTFDGSHYVLSNGVACDSKARVCSKSKLNSAVEPPATQALFGPASPAAKADADVTLPMAGVICDKESGFCVDSEGISMGITKDYLGAGAEAKMMEKFRSNPKFDTTSYVFSNGIGCNSAKKVCTSARGKVEARYTKHLFGG